MDLVHENRQNEVYLFRVLLTLKMDLIGLKKMLEFCIIKKIMDYST